MRRVRARAVNLPYVCQNGHRERHLTWIPHTEQVQELECRQCGGRA